MTKKLHKSSTDKAIAGVCGGIAEYFEIDSIIIRLLFVLLTLGAGSGLLIYIACAIIMPDERKIAERSGYANYSSTDYTSTGYTSTDYSSADYGSTEYTSYTSSESGEYTDSYQDNAANGDYSSYSSTGSDNYNAGSYNQAGGNQHQHKQFTQRQNLGVILIALAALILLKYFIPRIPDAIMLAGVLLLGGFYLIFRKK